MRPSSTNGLVEHRLRAMYRRLRVIEAILHNDVASTKSRPRRDLPASPRHYLLSIPMQLRTVLLDQIALDLVRIQLGLRRAELETRLIGV